VPPEGDLWQRDTYGFVFPQLYQGGGRFENSIPDITVSGYATAFGAARSLLSPTTDFQFGDHLTWLKGAHGLKVGGLVVRNRKDQNGRSLYAGQVDFNPSGNPRSTGNAFADALLGNFATYNEAQLDPMGFFRFWQAEAFVSDDWRISRNLSIEAGVRYTWHQPMYTQANNMASFDPARYDPAHAVTVNRNGTLVPNSGDRYDGMVRAGDGVHHRLRGHVLLGNAQGASLPAGADALQSGGDHVVEDRRQLVAVEAQGSHLRHEGGRVACQRTPHHRRDGLLAPGLLSGRELRRQRLRDLEIPPLHDRCCDGSP